MATRPPVEKLEQMPIAELIPYARNARTHSDVQVQQIAASIREFGFLNPVLIDEASTIIAGHGRVLAAHVLELDRVPCRRISNLTAAQKQAYVIADNQLAMNAGWDRDLLGVELSDIITGDVPVELLGFDPDELKELLSVDEQPPEDVPAQTDRAEELRDEWKTEAGQLWTIQSNQEHRLLCGDCRDANDVARLMDGKQAAMVFTDPPYNHGSEDKGVAASVSQAHAELKQSEWDSGFEWASVSLSIETVMADDCTVYVCASWHTAPDIWSWMATRSSHHSYCVWHKQNPMPSLMKRHWTWASELICYATYGKHTFNFPAEGHASNVWTIIKQSDGTHPTQKPVAVPAQAISHSSNAGDIVADPFLGSGTTMLAAEQLNRRCYGMEISPAYCAVILQRMKDAGCTCTLE